MGKLFDLIMGLFLLGCLCAGLGMVGDAQQQANAHPTSRWGRAVAALEGTDRPAPTGPDLNQTINGWLHPAAAPAQAPVVYLPHAGQSTDPINPNCIKLDGTISHNYPCP